MSDSPEEEVDQSGQPSLLYSRQWHPVERRSFDPEDDADLVTVVIGGVAAAEGVDPTAVATPPLGSVIDVEAVERALFERGGVEAAAMRFVYRGTLVEIRGDGRVTVFQ
ncbi:HalOD1 output domain-containing protein [Halobaculum sp. MBLA0143]|uniref:HalOD1 output domain-containing protein n=1 Tax=Halobaculum sp. MBLA0143 TaxID=3079933 RepID=UPI003523B6B9